MADLSEQTGARSGRAWSSLALPALALLALVVAGLAAAELGRARAKQRAGASLDRLRTCLVGPEGAETEEGFAAIERGLAYAEPREGAGAWPVRCASHRDDAVRRVREIPWSPSAAGAGGPEARLAEALHSLLDEGERRSARALAPRWERVELLRGAAAIPRGPAVGSDGPRWTAPRLALPPTLASGVAWDRAGLVFSYGEAPPKRLRLSDDLAAARSVPPEERPATEPRPETFLDVCLVEGVEHQVALERDGFRWRERLVRREGDTAVQGGTLPLPRYALSSFSCDRTAAFFVGRVREAVVFVECPAGEPCRTSRSDPLPRTQAAALGREILLVHHVGQRTPFAQRDVLYVQRGPPEALGPPTLLLSAPPGVGLRPRLFALPHAAVLLVAGASGGQGMLVFRMGGPTTAVVLDDEAR